MGGRIKDLDPNVLIEGVDSMKLDVRRNNVLNITFYTSQDPFYRIYYSKQTKE